MMFGHGQMCACRIQCIPLDILLACPLRDAASELLQNCGPCLNLIWRIFDVRNWLSSAHGEPLVQQPAVYFYIAQPSSRVGMMLLQDGVQNATEWGSTHSVVTCDV